MLARRGWSVAIGLKVAEARIFQRDGVLRRGIIEIGFEPDLSMPFGQVPDVVVVGDQGGVPDTWIGAGHGLRKNSESRSIKQASFVERLFAPQTFGPVWILRI